MNLNEIQIARLLDLYAADSMREMERLVAAVTFTIIIGNADGHGKNISLIHRSPGVIELAPLYDTVPTVMWPNLPATAAMTVNGQTMIDDIRLSDIAEEAALWSIRPEVAKRCANDTVEAILSNLDPVPDELASTIEQRARRFREDA